MDVMVNVSIIIFGMVLIIRPNKLREYYIKKDENRFKNINKELLTKINNKIFILGGIYCVVLGTLSIMLDMNTMLLIVLYFLIPGSTIYILETKLIGLNK